MMMVVATTRMHQTLSKMPKSYASDDAAQVERIGAPVVSIVGAISSDIVLIVDTLKVVVVRLIVVMSSR